MQSISANRTAGLERLSQFLPRSGKDYASLRNYDRPNHPHVSTLSPYLKHRILTESEVLRSVLGRYAYATAEKFIQEVFWRTYWKGWLEMRPEVWRQYQTGLRAALNRVQTEAGLRAAWDAACHGQTGIEAFDHWAQELNQTGYLHNHARMWFASIWIFTLRLPWELGADFFLRSLLDGDAASNTLSWRWVGGLQTRGKTYLARADNIAKYTDGRFGKIDTLASSAPPLSGPEAPARRTAPIGETVQARPGTLLILTDDDLSPGFVLDQLRPEVTLLLDTTAQRSPLAVCRRVSTFTQAALSDCATRYADRLGEVHRVDAKALNAWLADRSFSQIATPYSPTGWTRDCLDQTGAPIKHVLRPFDARAWPHATHGFFRFKTEIPGLLEHL